MKRRAIGHTRSVGVQPNYDGYPGWMKLKRAVTLYQSEGLPESCSIKYLISATYGAEATKRLLNTGKKGRKPDFASN